MTTTGQPPIPEMTAEDHIRESMRYAASADEHAGASGYEHVARRTNDLLAAQVHATLAQTLTAAGMMPMMAALAESVAPARPVAPAAGDDQEENR